jgi:probable F420-dependent oxidoreductase
MNYGVTITGAGPMAEPDKLRRLARRADELGFNSLWLFDHVAYPGKNPEKAAFTPETPFLAPIPTLAYLAADTKRIKLGTGVLLLALRHPLQAAKDVATLDVISGGRVIFGVGLGWLADEFDALGVPFKERAGRVRESVQILRGIWKTGRLAHSGKYYQFNEVTSYPMPVQPGGPPIWFGAAAEPALKRAAEVGDGWLGIGGPVESVTKRIRKIREFANTAGKKDFAIAIGASPEISREEAAQLQQAGANQINFGFMSGSTEEVLSKMESAASEFLPQS